MFMENYKAAKYEMKNFIMKKKTKSWTLSEHPLSEVITLPGLVVRR